MKHLKIAVLALLLIGSVSNSNAQDENNPWMTTLGTNFISVSDADSENYVPWLSKLAVSRHLGKAFSLELAGSANRISKPWDEGNNVTFASVDLNLKFDLNPNSTGWFDPYLFAGIGENWVGTENGLGLGAGLGINSWISKSVAITLSSQFKSVNTPEEFDMWQHSLGLSWRFGKSDTDGDGIRDKDDECPRVAGLAEFNGCPDTDSDNDGVSDCCDKCPDTPGLKEFKGCPDTDGDGIPDVKDKCPEVAGSKKMHGCPDADGDGVTDKDDACPEVPGPKTNAGCPFKDTDEDGVIDLIDRCVEVPGPASNDGCPEVFVDQDSVDEAAKGIVFDTGKAEIKDEVAAILDNVAVILNQNGNLQFRFSVEGHTDSTGGDARNQTLSEQRANSVKNYLVSKGVDGNRLQSKGFGENNPVDDNNTKEGRQNNRRVEINEMK